MKLKELALKINEESDKLDLVSTRKYIESNLDLLYENKQLLNRNARELLDFLRDRKNNGEKPLNRTEMAAIHAMNTYALRFDVQGLKMTVKNKKELLLKKETLGFLNSDAKILLEGMGAIEKQQKKRAENP
ncbi:hypothetical protein FZC79_08390 [Rossellomorea vietnamensis]|uniref:Uncharacterized protein n=2 Tax=Rossellomorea TaxID=2837508 RepID=A0A5D4KH03_9BACI|nr:MULTISPECIES: hypothetical protein [Rossellomorea]TYR76159.1 hypothetical protein FZC79_08390 [Rossellomorea vietnamensis]TYS74080.1 hypothetical protein FZC80_18815 [Rossellomorea aquimaris]